jgi:hypothetical protein
MGKATFLTVGCVLTAFLAVSAEGKPLTLPFDFSRSAILLNVAVRGTPLRMFLDTGVSPSTIDIQRAKGLALHIDYAGGGEASGDGTAKSVVVYPTIMDGLQIGGQSFSSIEALTLDMKPISSAYGSTVDGTLGFSFLAGRLVLIDYPAHAATIFSNRAEATQQLATCRKVWRVRLKSFQGDHIPVVELKIGNTRLPVSIDTGSNGNLELFTKALDNPAMAAVLSETGSSTATGTRGAYTVRTQVLQAPLSFGPFKVPAGQIVTLSKSAGSMSTRLGNVGNKLIASMQLKLLLDYRENQMAFYGECRN